MKHSVIYVPGLGDQRSGSQRLAVGLWRIYGVRPEVFVFGWSTAESYEAKFNRLIDRIDTLHGAGHTVSLVGVSAGASAVVNAFAVRQDRIKRVVCLCGKLQGSSSGTLGVSLANLPSSLGSIDGQTRRRVLSIRPLSDQVVPPEQTVLNGTLSSVIPTNGHVMSIALGITVFSWKVVRFIRG